MAQSEVMYGVVSASKIIGEAVENRQQEKLGKIHELVIDAKEGRVAYAVLSFGGFLGMGNKLFAMPWNAFEFSSTENKLILNVDKQKLEMAPGFDRDAKWPDFADRTWGTSIYKYDGYDPYWNGRRARRARPRAPRVRDRQAAAAPRPADPLGDEVWSQGFSVRRRFPISRVPPHERGGTGGRMGAQRAEDLGLMGPVLEMVWRPRANRPRRPPPQGDLAVHRRHGIAGCRGQADGADHRARGVL